MKIRKTSPYFDVIFLAMFRILMLFFVCGKVLVRGVLHRAEELSAGARCHPHADFPKNKVVVVATALWTSDERPLIEHK